MLLLCPQCLRIFSLRYLSPCGEPLTSTECSIRLIV